MKEFDYQRPHKPATNDDDDEDAYSDTNQNNEPLKDDKSLNGTSTGTSKQVVANRKGTDNGYAVQSTTGSGGSAGTVASVTA